MYEDIKHTLGEKMTYSAWNVNKAAEIGNAKGQTIGYVAGLYSTPGIANECAASAEVLNQYGYSIYQDDQTGKFRIIRDRDTQGGSIWTSDTLGMTFDYTGDSLVTSTVDSGWRGSFSDSCNNTLNRLDAANSSNSSWGATSGLNSNETLDPITGQPVDKEKSKEIDALADTKSARRKFDKIAKLINKVHEKQNAATVTTDASATKTNTTVGGLAGGAAIGTCFGGFPIGTVVGGVIGGVVGFFGGSAIAKSDKKDANKVNNESAEAAKAAGDELKAALEGLSDEEMIAFERYYYEQTGVEVADVLQELEVGDGSSTIAQQSGIDGDYLDNLFDDMDKSNEILKPGNTEDTTGAKEYTETQKAKIQILEQEAAQYYNMWQAALNGETVTFEDKEISASELSEMYLNKVQELEDYKNSL